MLRAGVCGFQPQVRPWSERCLLPPDRFHLATTGTNVVPRADNQGVGAFQSVPWEACYETPLGPISGRGSERAD
jgi:hypothetical protein